MSNIDDEQSARAFLEAHNRLREIARDLAPYEERYLSFDGLGSAGMEVDGVLNHYTARSNERAELAAELRRLRTEAGDENILAELKKMSSGEKAIEYIQKVPLEESGEKKEAQRETHKGWFGRFR